VLLETPLELPLLLEPPLELLVELPVELLETPLELPVLLETPLELLLVEPPLLEPEPELDPPELASVRPPQAWVASEPQTRKPKTKPTREVRGRMLALRSEGRATRGGAGKAVATSR
jgi:hypothetical protein